VRASSHRGLRFKNYDELNAWLLDKCIAYAKAHRHPELTEQTGWQVFEAERPKIVPYAGRLDGFHAVPASVSKTCLVRFDNNKYSWRRAPSDVRSRSMPMPIAIVIRQDGQIVAEHPSLVRPRRYVVRPLALLARSSPKARRLAQLALPSKTGSCRPRWSALRASLAGAADGNRQMSTSQRGAHGRAAGG